MHKRILTFWCNVKNIFPSFCLPFKFTYDFWVVQKALICLSFCLSVFITLMFPLVFMLRKSFPTLALDIFIYIFLCLFHDFILRIQLVIQFYVTSFCNKIKDRNLTFFLDSYVILPVLFIKWSLLSPPWFEMLLLLYTEFLCGLAYIPGYLF